MKGTGLCGPLSVLLVTPALAAGFQVKEHSADAMAAAYAGAAATGTDASYVAYNPAAAAAVIDGDFSLDAVEILPGSRGTYLSATTSAGTAAGGSPHPAGFIRDATIPAFGARYRLSDRWSVGLAITAPWGLQTDYPQNWAGRYYALKTELLTVNATPVLAYRLTPTIAVAAGPQIEYARGVLTSDHDGGTLGLVFGIPGSVPGVQDTYARLSGTGWGYGFAAGATARTDGGLTLGFSYHSPVEHDLRGPLTFTLDHAGIGEEIRALTGIFSNTRGDTKVTMPDTASLGARQEFSDSWSGLLELDWTNWSRVHTLRVVAANPQQPEDLTNLQWHDSWFGSLGLEYRADSRWTIRAGAGYDETPVPASTRAPGLPDANRLWLSTGVSYRWSMSTDVKFAASHVLLADAHIALDPSGRGDTFRGSLSGRSTAYVNVAGLQIVFR